MEIKASSSYDFKTIKTFFLHALFRKINPKKGIIIISLFIILLYVIVILGAVISDTPETFIKVLAYLLGLTIFLFYFYFRGPKLCYKNMQKLASINNEFIFTDTNLIITSNNDSVSGETNTKYSGLYKVMETDSYLFIYQNKVSAYIVDKSTIEGGTVEDIRKAISSVLGDKYIVCNY